MTHLYRLYLIPGKRTIRNSNHHAEMILPNAILALLKVFVLHGKLSKTLPARVSNKAMLAAIIAGQYGLLFHINPYSRPHTDIIPVYIISIYRDIAKGRNGQSIPAAFPRGAEPPVTSPFRIGLCISTPCTRIY